MTSLDSAVLQAYKGLQAVMGKNITYSRPSTGHSVAIVKAVPGRSQHDVTSNGMVVEQVQSRDYLVPVSALVLNGVNVLPEKGDRITEGSKTYAVLCMGTEAQWKYTDQTQLIVRIHTKEI